MCVRCCAADLQTPATNASKPLRTVQCILRRGSGRTTQREVQVTEDSSSGALVAAVTARFADLVSDRSDVSLFLSSKGGGHRHPLRNERDMQHHGFQFLFVHTFPFQLEVVAHPPRRDPAQPCRSASVPRLVTSEPTRACDYAFVRPESKAQDPEEETAATAAARAIDSSGSTPPAVHCLFYAYGNSASWHVITPLERVLAVPPGMSLGTVPTLRACLALIQAGFRDLVSDPAQLRRTRCSPAETAELECPSAPTSTC
jgi:hypothetical protein